MKEENLLQMKSSQNTAAITHIKQGGKNQGKTSSGNNLKLFSGTKQKTQGKSNSKSAAKNKQKQKYDLYNNNIV